MMKNIFFFCLVCLLGVSSLRAQVNDTTEMPGDENTEANLQDGIIPDTVKYFDMVLHAEQYTWKDFDDYYKITIPFFHSHRSYTENLKKATIAGLVHTGKLQEIQDKAVVEWYTQEFVSLYLPDTDVLIPMLSELKGYWSDEKIRQTAKVAYENSVRYIRQNLKNPDAALSRLEQKLDRLKAFAEDKH